MTDPSGEHGADPVRSPSRPADGDDPRPPDAAAPADADADADRRDEAAPDDTSGSWTELSTDEPAQGMLPARRQRRTKLERGSMRVLATGGIVGLATILGAVLVSQDVAGWIVGLAIGLTSVVLAAILWSSRQL